MDLYISSYTGPLHVADGAGTATVAIGTPARHRSFRPLGPRHRCATADRVADLTAAAVLAAAASALGDRLPGAVGVH
jgi:ADP-heptose:LPS heptosyltransferase